MSEEKRRILEMLEAGKITQEDAARLLDALGEESSSPAPEESAGSENVKTDWAEVLENLGAGVDKAVKEAIQAAAPSLESLGAEVDATMKQALNVLKNSTVSESFRTTANPMDIPLPLEENAYPASVGGPVNSLRIEWVNGPVEIRLWDGETIRVAEYAGRPLEEGERMELQEENGCLHIRWNREKTFRGKIFLQKHLVVDLPKNASLGDIRIDNVSGGTYLSGLQGDGIRVTAVSGPIMCWNLRGEILRIETVSGGISLYGVSSRELRVSGTSGRVYLEGFAAEQLRVETVSGAVTAQGNGEDLNLSTISGALTLQVEQYPKRVKLKSVSGKVTMLLPQQDLGFYVEYSSISGGFSTQFPLTGELGKRKGKVIYGQGGAKFRIDTVSGRIELRKLVPVEE